MNLRGRLLLGSILLTAVPLVLVVLIIHARVEARFTAQDTARVTQQTRVSLRALAQRSSDLAERLAALAEGIDQDNDFRLAVLAGRVDLRPYLRDYAGRTMSLMDLDMLQIVDPNGEVLSSGHHRSAFGQSATQLIRPLTRTPDGHGLLTVATPDGPFLALCRTYPFTLGGEVYNLIGGLGLNEDQLADLVVDTDVGVAIVWPGGVLAGTEGLRHDLDDLLQRDPDILKLDFRLQRRGYILQTTDLPLIQDGQTESARLLVVHDRAGLRALLRDLNLQVGGVLVLAVLASLILAVIFANGISRPLRDLAARTENLDLDRLDVDFTSRRRDEVGRLTRLLGEMTARLRLGVARLQQAEHRATLGEVARQVNHDIRNGITPLRNVLGHLSEVAEQEPDQLSRVFAERRGTLAEGLAYLEDLAGHYARLSPGRDLRPVDLSPVLEAVLENLPALRRTGVDLRIETDLPGDLPPVLADPIGLRRIFENLVRNAIEAMPDGGCLDVQAEQRSGDELEEARVLVTVADTGTGIDPDNLDRIFNDFFTTKEEGTGLGLSNVRRLVGDYGGRIAVTSPPGHGTTFTITFPATAPAPPRP